MKAVDTNIAVRALVDDDPQQVQTARAVLAGPFWIAKTVLLETAWVLEDRYGLTRIEALDAVTTLIGLPNASVEDADAVTVAFGLVREGMDFADALHVVSRPAGTLFVSFDRKLVTRATRAGMPGVRLP